MRALEGSARLRIEGGEHGIELALARLERRIIERGRDLARIGESRIRMYEKGSRRTGADLN